MPFMSVYPSVTALSSISSARFQMAVSGTLPSRSPFSNTSAIFPNTSDICCQVYPLSFISASRGVVSRFWPMKVPSSFINRWPAVLADTSLCNTLAIRASHIRLAG